MNEDELEPFLLIFAVLAVVLGVIIFVVRGGDDAPAPVAVATPEATVAPEAEPLPTPTAEPTAVPEAPAASPAGLTIDTSADPVVISGLVPDQAAKDAVIAQAEALFGEIVDEVEIDDTTTLDGGAITLTGQAADDENRSAIAAQFAGLGLDVDNQLTLPDLSTLGDIAASRPELSQLADLLDQAGLGGVLTGEGPVTVFAPTNDAIGAVPADVLDRVAGDPDLLGQVLGFHVVDGVITAEDAVAAGTLETTQGESIIIAASADQVTASGAPLSETDIEASNGVLHILDGLMVPPSITNLITEETVAAAVELESIQFASGSAELLPASEITLAAVAQILNETPGSNVLIEGHTDSDGDPASNLQLSQDRAETVRVFLVEQGGVDADRLTTEGFGDTVPIADNDTPEGRQQNRRIEFKLS